MAYSKQTWDTNSIFNPTRMNHIEDGIKDTEVLLGNSILNRYKVLADFGWDYTEKTINYTSAKTVILFGARGAKGILFIIPINNQEICKVYDTFGVTISHSTSDYNNHSITISSASSPHGGSCQLYILGIANSL